MELVPTCGMARSQAVVASYSKRGDTYADSPDKYREAYQKAEAGFDLTATNPSSVSVGEIVVIPTVPTQLPVQFTVSPATLLSAGGPGGE